jgi:hypothetical protein
MDLELTPNPHSRGREMRTLLRWLMGKLRLAGASNAPVLKASDNWLDLALMSLRMPTVVG